MPPKFARRPPSPPVLTHDQSLKFNECKFVRCGEHHRYPSFTVKVELEKISFRLFLSDGSTAIMTVVDSVERDWLMLDEGSLYIWEAERQLKTLISRDYVRLDDSNQRVCLSHVVRFLQEKKETITKKVTITKRGWLFTFYDWVVED